MSRARSSGASVTSSNLSPAEGPALYLSPAEGPALYLSPAEGPALYLSPAEGPAPYLSPAEGPAPPLSPAEGPALYPSPAIPSSLSVVTYDRAYPFLPGRWARVLSKGMGRSASAARKTKETDIEVTIELDGTGVASVQTPLPFLTHMVEQIAKHGLFDVTVRAKGDVEIDGHHTTEDL